METMGDSKQIVTCAIGTQAKNFCEILGDQQ